MNKNSVEQNSEHSPESLVGNAPDRSKRRGLILGGGVGAILATVKSGSALAEGICVAPSAFSSIKANSATSHKPKSFAVCSSHGFYGNSGATDLDDRWKPVSRATATVSNAGFSGAGLWTTDTKLFDIVKTGNDSSWKPDGNIIVVYLDVMTGRAGGILAEEDVKDMWKILFGIGTANPKFIGWDAQKVRDFYSVWVGDVKL